MAYQQMAGLYDRFMANAPYDAWVNLSEEIMKQSGKEVKSIVDLGCGTGEITTRLAKKGYTLIGIDYSSDMLTFAEQKANEQNVSIQWLKQDLRSLEGISNVDMAISYCDVMNYITTEAELRDVFIRVANSLKHEGLFVFDVHAFNHVQDNLRNQTFADVTDDSSYIWFCSEGEVAGEMYHDLTFFSLDEGKYIRFDESHHQRTFPVETYRQLLAEAGFQINHIYGDFLLTADSVHKETERIFFITEKKSG